MPVFTIHEAVMYDVEANTAQEAYEKFMEAKDINVYLNGVTDRYVTDEMGEDCGIYPGL